MCLVTYDSFSTDQLLLYYTLILVHFGCVIGMLTLFEKYKVRMFFSLSENNIFIFLVYVYYYICIASFFLVSTRLICHSLLIFDKILYWFLFVFPFPYIMGISFVGSFFRKIPEDFNFFKILFNPLAPLPTPPSAHKDVP